MAYYDDTGKPSDTPVVSLFGCVADVDQWMRFDNDWRIVLDLPQFQLPYFHMREVRQGSKAKNPAFHKFQDNEALRRDLFGRLQSLIKIRIEQSFSAVVVMSAYNRLNGEYEVAEKLGSPASVATALAIGKFLAWRKHVHPGEPFKVVCDQGMDEWGKLDANVYKSWRFRLIPGVVKDIPGLQASDFAAWELQRAFSAVLGGKTTHKDLRPTFMQFLRQFTFRVGDERRIPWFLVDDVRLAEMIERCDVPKRQSPSLASLTRAEVR